MNDIPMKNKRKKNRTTFRKGQPLASRGGKARARSLKLKKITREAEYEQMRIDRALLANEAAFRHSDTLRRVLTGSFKQLDEMSNNPANNLEVIMLQCAHIITQPVEKLTALSLSKFKAATDWMKMFGEQNPIPTPNPLHELALPKGINWENLLEAVLQDKNLTALQKYRMLDTMIYHHESIQNAKANCFSIEEMRGIMRAASSAANQTLAKTPDLLAKWAVIFDELIQGAIPDRVLSDEQLSATAPDLAGES